jgi:hypothetical protein
VVTARRLLTVLDTIPYAQRLSGNGVFDYLPGRAEVAGMCLHQLFPRPAPQDNDFDVRVGPVLPFLLEAGADRFPALPDRKLPDVVGAGSAVVDH